MTAAHPEPAAPSLAVGPYCLEVIRAVRQDDLASLWGSDPWVYICNCPEPAWYAHFGLLRQQNLGVQKKQRMFACLPPGSRWVSMTHDASAPGRTRAWQGPSGIAHLGRGVLRGRLMQAWQAAQLTAWLWRARRSYAGCYVYNFDQPQYAAALLAKACLGKRLVVDYEDDTTPCRKSRFKNALEALMRRTADGAVCVHAAMQGYFPPGHSRVFNAFACLDYMPQQVQLHPGMSFLYSGRLDSIRGADLIPDLVHALRRVLPSFTIQITGSGPLRSTVQGWQLPEVQYLGFVSDARLLELTAAADACLILQKPDHPFSQGSFPSKIETYAAQKKIIYALTLPAP